ncbi:DUF6049 family protein [Jatrophihabitans fulvus]
MGLAVLTSLGLGGPVVAPALAPAAATPPITPDSTPAVPRTATTSGTSAHRARATARATTPVTIAVARISPSTPTTPKRSSSTQKLRFTLSVTNNGDSTIRGARVLAFRGEPIGNQAALEQSLADTSAPKAEGLDIAPTARVRVDLTPGQLRTFVFTTTAGLANGPGLCLCDNKIYPMTFAVRADDGAGDVLGTTRTYVPSIYRAVEPTRVSWVWPLIDRPHRMRSDTVFTDDALAASVAEGGRLDRALRVLEDVSASGDGVPVTIVVDPELLDELAVMATGKYTVRTGSGKSIRGTGESVATAWLARFTGLLGSDDAMQVSLTPFADPDVQALAGTRIDWTAGLPAEMAARVQDLLGGREPLSDVAWPATGAVGARALADLVASGASTVVLNSTGITPSTADSLPVAVSTLRSGGTRVTAAVISNQLRATTAAAVGPDDGGQADLPRLVSEVAIRSIEADDTPTYAVLAPPRYVDPDPDRASRAILDTSVSPFATAIPLRSLGRYRPEALSTLRVPRSTVGLPGPNLSAAADTDAARPTLDSLLGTSNRSADAETLLESLPQIVQRLTSSAWRPTDDSPFDDGLGPQIATGVARYITGLLTSVRIVRPSSGTYTLGSEESRLPITVENDSSYTVQVQVLVRSQDDLPGYSMTESPETQQIPPNSKLTVRVPSRLDRTGRIPIEAQLLTSTGAALGDEVPLYVRGTVFGTVGVIITVVSGGVLALALLVRFARRVRRLRRQAAQRRGTASRSRAAAGAPGGRA